MNRFVFYSCGPPCPPPACTQPASTHITTIFDFPTLCACVHALTQLSPPSLHTQSSTHTNTPTHKYGQALDFPALCARETTVAAGRRCVGVYPLFYPHCIFFLCFIHTAFFPCDSPRPLFFDRPLFLYFFFQACIHVFTYFCIYAIFMPVRIYIYI